MFLTFYRGVPDTHGKPYFMRSLCRHGGRQEYGLSSKMAEGTFTWEYNVQDANQVEAIELPKECAGQKPADDVPMPPNATDKSGLGRMMTFKTLDVAAFYKQKKI